MKYIKDFKVSTGKICLISAITDILNYYEYNLKEEDLFGLCEGQLFYFGGLDEKSEDELKDVHLLRELKMGGMKYDIMKMFELIQNILNVEIVGYEYQNSNHLQSIIKEYVDKNIPLIAFASRYYLEYFDNCSKDKFSHTIAVYGYDFEKDQVYVTDTYVATKPVSTYKGPLSLNNFIKALDLSEVVFEMPTKKSLIAVYPKDKNIMTDLPFQIRINSLVNIAKNNLSGSVIQHKIYTGIDGMRKFVQEFKTWKHQYSVNLLKQLLKTVHNLITNYGGPYVTNGLLAGFIEELYNVNRQPFYLELQGRFINIQKQWLIIANLCFKASLGDIFDSYDRISNYIERLIDEQELLYFKLLALDKGEIERKKEYGKSKI